MFKKIMSILKSKRKSDILLIIICIAIGIFLIIGVLFFCKFTNIFSLINFDEKIGTFLKESSGKDAVQLNVVVAILRNSAFVIQFAAWVVSLGAIALALFTFFGIKERMNFQALRQELESDYSKFKTKFTDIDEKIKFEYKITQAKIFYTQEFYDEAWDILSKLSEKNYESVLYKGLTKSQKKDYSEAITLLENALKFREADLARIYYNIGNCWCKMQQYETSMLYFDKAIAEKSNYVQAYNEKALSLRRIGDLGQALKVLATALSIDEKNTQAYYNSACYYAILGEKEKAIDNLKRAIDINSRKYKDLACKDPDFENLKGKNDDFDSLLD